MRGMTKQLVKEAGFEVIESAIEIQIEAGVEIPFHWILAQKR